MIDLQILAAELKMTTLIEVHGMENLMRVRDCVIGLPLRGYSLLGLNNRDLNSFTTDLGVTLRLAELVADRDVLVSESGIHGPRDIQKLGEAGVRAVLVGESLMRQQDIAAATRRLFQG
jgi:indole-3-glycerol phosphate synthase